MNTLPAGLTHRPSATLALALAVSLGLHAALLAIAALLALPHGTPPDLIRVALIGGGGGGGGPAGTNEAQAPAGAAAAAPRPPAEEHPPRTSMTSARAVPDRPSTDHPVRAPAAHAVHSDAESARPAPVEGRSDREPAVADVARVGNGAGAGSGTGSGPGAGTGSGGGSGSGSGSGVGPGSGAGAAGDVRALCLSCPEPQYPRLARVRGWQGTVDVEIAIGADGKVADASVARSSGYAALDDAALDVARRSRFKLAGIERDVRGRIAYGFRLTAP